MQPTFEVLIKDNLALLDQLIAVVLRLDDGDYQDSVGEETDSLGAHVRHILDHYSCFIHGLKKGRIDYDQRERNETVQCNREAALAGIQDVQLILSQLPQEVSGDRMLQVKMDCGNSAAWTDSSLVRELQFLANHSLHHFAILRLLIRNEALIYDDAFGLAPSTLKHRERQKQTESKTEQKGDDLCVR